MNLNTIPLSTLNTVSRPHESLGIVQGYAQHQLGFGSRFGATISNWFGGSNTFNHSIGEKFIELKTEAMQNLITHATDTYTNKFDCIAGVQFELLTMEINQGRDTMLICNVSGTPIKYIQNKNKNTPTRNSRSRGGGGRRKMTYRKKSYISGKNVDTWG
jgi:hypothetical protein